MLRRHDRGMFVSGFDHLAKPGRRTGYKHPCARSGRHIAAYAPVENRELPLPLGVAKHHNPQRKRRDLTEAAVSRRVDLTDIVQS